MISGAQGCRGVGTVTLLVGVTLVVGFSVELVVLDVAVFELPLPFGCLGFWLVVWPVVDVPFSGGVVAVVVDVLELF